MKSFVAHNILPYLQHLAFLVCILPFCTACHTEDSIDELPTNRILIAYLSGDNSLSSEINQKINALATGFLNTESNNLNNRLFIYRDNRDAQPQLIEISNTHNGPLRTLKTYPAQNSADASIMAQVLRDVLNNYSATSYGLIIFSHGTAWLPTQGLTNPYTAPAQNMKDHPTNTRTVATDGSNELELIDFAASLPLPRGQKWDFILFENCYMASIEVAYELKDKTEAILASATEILSPGMTEIYPSALSLLYQPAPSLESFAKAYFDLWNAKSGNYRSATISVIRTARLAELGTLARAAFIRWQPDANSIASLQCFNRNKWHLFFDLEEAIVTANPALQTYLSQLLPHIVTYAAATPSFIQNEPYGFNLLYHCGLSCYIPQHEFFYINTVYKQTAWSKEFFY